MSIAINIGVAFEENGMICEMLYEHCQMKMENTKL